mmetsp:Transcript_15238/g.31420  ORF Transcript_15238/g.31420 Transcript_15238/m.31420 type:complete len:89 (-) Transcript_15238:605-871(-)
MWARVGGRDGAGRDDMNVQLDNIVEWGGGLDVKGVVKRERTTVDNIAGVRGREERMSLQRDVDTFLFLLVDEERNLEIAMNNGARDCL